jgi:hypothetical protein
MWLQATVTLARFCSKQRPSLSNAAVARKETHPLLLCIAALEPPYLPLHNAAAQLLHLQPAEGDT